MFWLPKAPTNFNWPWFLHHADSLFEMAFLVVLSGLACAWIARRPQELRWFLMALALFGTGFLIPVINGLIVDDPRFPLRVLRQIFIHYRPRVEIMQTVVVTLLRCGVWGCLLYAAFSDRPQPPPQPEH